MGENLKELADWVTARKRRTFEGAVLAIAKKQGKSLAEFMVETCDEICASGGPARLSSKTLMRRIVAAAEEEVARRRSVEPVAIPGGEDSRARFALPVVLSMRERVLLGLLARHSPEFFTGGRFAAVLGALLAEECAKCGRIGRSAFSVASGAVEWEPGEDGRPKIGRRLSAAPGVLAMPDNGAPLGFRLLADVQVAKKRGEARKL